jgi:hypothetical protein
LFNIQIKVTNFKIGCGEVANFAETPEHFAGAWGTWKYTALAQTGDFVYFS